MVKLVVLCVLLVVQFASTNQQLQHQCEFVCDGQLQGTNIQIRGLKGERGGVGRPGKTGPRGHRGPRGGRGIQGLPDREELLALVKAAMKQPMIEFNRNLEDLSDRVDLISSQLNQNKNKLDNLYLDVHPPSTTPQPTTRPPPESCKTSEVEGRQFLRSGDEVYCEDGWQVFQKRFDGSVSFHQFWAEYKNGFGDLSTEFWMGLDKLHRITAASTRCRLRVDVWDFSDGQAYAEYSNFSIGNEESFYQLTIGGYYGSASDAMGYLNGNKFTTRDKDNDQDPNDNSAVECGGGGGWWYNRCVSMFLNSVWLARTNDGTMSWRTWKHEFGGIRASKMKVKCD